MAKLTIPPPEPSTLAPRVSPPGSHVAYLAAATRHAAGLTDPELDALALAYEAAMAAMEHACKFPGDHPGLNGQTDGTSERAEEAETAFLVAIHKRGGHAAVAAGRLYFYRLAAMPNGYGSEAEFPWLASLDLDQIV